MKSTVWTLTAVLAVLLLACSAYGAPHRVAGGKDPGAPPKSNAHDDGDEIITAQALAHPRIWLNTTILNRLITAKNANSAEWVALQNWCNARLGQNLGSGYNFLDWYKLVMNYGLAYRITGNQSYGNEGVKYLKGLLRDRTTLGDGLGGATAITVDSGYVSRSLGTGVAVGRDWLHGSSDLTTSVINECTARMADWYTWVTTDPDCYGFNEPSDNYYSGHFTMIYTASIAFEDDSGYQSAWQTMAESMWTAIVAYMNNEWNNGDWLEGWNYGPWSAREYLGYPFALETGTTRPNHWNEIDWANELAKSHVSMLYPSRAYFSDNGCWSGDNKGDPRSATCLMLSILSDTSTSCKGLAVWFANRLEWEPAAIDEWEAMLYTDSSVAEVAPTAGTVGGLSWGMWGHSVARSADWSNQEATFVDVVGYPTHSEEYNVGEVKIGSRQEQLLVDGQMWQREGQYAGVPRITGNHTYAPYQEPWHDLVTFNFDSVDGVYAYSKINNMRNCYDGRDADNPSCSYFRRDVAFLEPDWVVVFDNITATSTSNLITEQWFTMGNPTISGDTATLTKANAKLFLRTVAPAVSMTKTDTSSTRPGTYRVDAAVSTPSVPNKIVTLFQAAAPTQGSMTAADLMQPTNFIGVHVKHATTPKIGLFATAENPAATSCTFTFTPVASPTKCLVIGMQASTNFSVNVTGSTSKTVTITTGSGYTSTANGALSFDVTSGAQPLTITTTSLPGGVVGTAYSQTLQATGGTTPYTWSIVSGSLPAGLTLGSSTGTISGTPTTANTYNFTARVTDNVAATDDQALSITITSAPADLVITTTSLPAGTVGTAYSQTVQATGGVTPYSWSISGGTLPAGLTLGSSTGTISGTPTTAGTSNFTVRVQDSQGTPDSDTQALSIVINPAGGGGTTEQFVASDGESSTTSTSYQTKATLTFTPATADDWVILGFAEYKGSSTSYSARVRLTIDGVAQNEITVEPVNATDYQSFTSMKVANLSAAAHTITIGYSSESTSATAYIRNARIVALRKASLEIQSTAVESQTTLGDMALICEKTFTPATAGDYLLIWSAELNASTVDYYTHMRASLNYVVYNTLLTESQDTSDWFTGAVFAIANLPATSQAIQIQSSRETGSTGTHYIRKARVAAIRLSGSRFGGYQSADAMAATTTQTTWREHLTKSWSASAGNWLLLSSFDVSNTTSGTTETRVQMDDTTTMANPFRRPHDGTDYMGGTCVDVRNLAAGTRKMDVDFRSSAATAAYLRDAHLAAIALPAGIADLIITTTSLPAGRVGTAYSQTLAATGGQTPYSWSMVSGSLPAGLSLGSSTGAISGTPTSAGTSNFTVRVTDSQGTPDTDDQALSITIYADLNVTTTSLPAGTVGIAYSQTLAATGGLTPYSWSVVSGSLPAGLSLSGGGVISGTPTTAQTSNFTVRVTDSQGSPDTDDQALSITINSGIQNLVITTTTLPAGTVGSAYSQTVVATGGVTPYTWSVISGSLPTGLSLGSSTGTISGTPTTAQTSNFTVRVTDSQGTPDTDDQALSITINPSGGGATYQFVVAESETSTTSTSWQTKATLTFTPSTADDWVILGFAEQKDSSTSYSAKVRLTVDGVAAGEDINEAKDTTDYLPFTALKFQNLSAASHTILVQYCSENAAATAYIRRARIVAIRKASLDIRSTASDTNTALTTTLVNRATLTWTPATAGDYLIIYSAEISARQDYSTQVQAKFQSTVYDDSWIESMDNSDYFTWMNFSLFSAGTSAVTANIAAAAETGTTGTHYIRKARIVAIRVNDGRFSDHVDKASDTEATTTSTSFVEKSTKSWTWGPNGNWLILVSGRVGGTSESYSTEARTQINNSTTSSQQLREPNDATDYMHFGSIDVANLTTTRQVDVDYRTENAAATAKIKYVRFYGLSLDD